MNKYAFAALAAVSALALGSSANAAPVVFTFTGAVSSASTPGVSAGDVATLRLSADNGGNSLSNQTWNLADLGGFTVDFGSYHASYSKVFEYPELGNFTTDASGTVTTAQFYGTSGASSNSDNFGAFFGDYVFGNASFVDSQGTNTQLTTYFTDPAQWTVALATPEPATWALMIVGFGMVGSAMRRKQAAPSFA